MGKGFFTDTSVCIGCKACEVACKQWNGLPSDGYAYTGFSYDNTGALSGATWAPAYIAYGDNNRTACVRIPGGRLELRLPDGSCNPYLATAAILAAGMDGVRRKLDPGQPNNNDLYGYSPEAIAEQGIGLLPQNLGEALTALEQDEVVRNALGRELAQEFITLKRMEWIEYSRHVSDWEVKRYLEFF